MINKYNQLLKIQTGAACTVCKFYILSALEVVESSLLASLERGGQYTGTGESNSQNASRDWVRHSEEFLETGAWKGQQTDGLLNSMKLKSIFFEIPLKLYLWCLEHTTTR